MHEGKNVQLLRTYRGIDKADMARRLDMAPDVYDQIEQSEHIIDDLLARIAKEMDYEPEFVRWVVNAGATYNYNQTNQDTSTVHSQIINNPVETVIELYERLLKSEQEKVALLQQQLTSKK